MSYYRTGVFLVKGLKHFTKNGYNEASKTFKPADMEVDLSGKVIMITGANSGIGKSAAIGLASKGAEIHMVCRNMERANAAKDEVVSASKNQKVYVHQLDMSNTADVYKFAAKFQEDHSKLNVLINNAGCMVHERKFLGPKEVETNFATNTLGTYVLTCELLKLLKSSDSARVITVSSGGQYLQKLNPKELQSRTGKFDGEMVYAQNKRQQVVLTEEWAKVHQGVHFSSMHPGWADTPAVRNSMPDFHRRLKDKLRTAEQGADTIVWLAAAPAATASTTRKNGGYFLDRTVQTTHLPLAWTKDTPQDRKDFLEKLQTLAQTLRV